MSHFEEHYRRMLNSDKVKNKDIVSPLHLAPPEIIRMVVPAKYWKDYLPEEEPIEVAEAASTGTDPPGDKHPAWSGPEDEEIEVHTYRFYSPVRHGAELRRARQRRRRYQW